MGCCCSAEKNADAEPTEAPVRQRRVHNFCWIILFILGCVASASFTLKAKNHKHFAPIYQNGVDSWGNICGKEVQDNEYGNIEKWDGGIMGNQPVGYPKFNNNADAPTEIYSELNRKEHTKVYNSGFPKHGTNLCLQECPGSTLPEAMFETTEDLQKLGALYMAGSADFTEEMFDEIIGQSFPELNQADIKNSLWCDKVASDNGYTSLELCNEQKVMMPSSTIVHMCTPHYKIALAVAKATMAAQNAADGARSENANNGTTDASWADRISEAGNAVIANQKTIFVCFFGAAVVAAIVILIIQILTKYLIYTVVTAFFVCAVTASAYVWYSYLQLANPQFLENTGIPTDLTGALCNQTGRILEMHATQRIISQRMIDPILDSSFITLDGDSMQVLEANFEAKQERFNLNFMNAEGGSGSFSDFELPDIDLKFQNMQKGRMCSNGTSASGNTEDQVKEIQTRFYTAIIVSVICLAVILAICCNCGNIRLAVNLFDEAGTCVFAIPGILFQPIYTMFISLIMMAICISQFLYVRQVFVPVVVPPDQPNAGQVVWMEHSYFWQYIWVFTFFITVWVWFFIDGCHQVTLAGAVNNWYWAQSESSIVGRCWNRLKCCPGAKSFCDLVKFSLGSVALGSMLVAIVATIRVIIKLIQHAGKKAAGGKETKLTKMLFACIQCLLACVQKFLEFINRNGYIGIAIFGYDFCRAAQKCLALKVENAGRALTLMFICRFVLMLGKICSVVGSCFLCKYLLKQDKSSEDMPIHSAAAVYGCVIIFSYWITTVFLSVYDLTLDTIFLCFCEDQQRNNGRDRPYKSSAKLQKFMRENA